MELTRFLESLQNVVSSRIGDRLYPCPDTDFTHEKSPVHANTIGIHIPLVKNIENARNMLDMQEVCEPGTEFLQKKQNKQVDGSL
jgi:hypothetical protein